MTGEEISNELKAVIVDRRVAQRRSFSEIAANTKVSKSACQEIVEHAKRSKVRQIESQNLVVTKEDKENWSTLDLNEPELLKSDSRSGRPRALSEDQINHLIASATA